MHSYGEVGERTKPMPTAFKANIQNDGFVRTTAAQKPRKTHHQSKAAQTFKIKNYDDGKGEDEWKHLNEGSVHKS